jgi:hypothetical protein
MTAHMDQKLARLLVLSQIISLLAIPVVLALVGFRVQQTLQDQQIKRDYVSLAVSLLSPKKEGEKETSPELRAWAAELLNDSAPVKLSHKQSESLRSEGLSLLPGDMIYLKGQRPIIYLGEGKVLRPTPEGKIEVQSIDPPALNR